MKKIYIVLALFIFIIGCEKEDAPEQQDIMSVEENILEKGISLNELKQSTMAKEGYLESIHRLSSGKNVESMDIEDLAERLDFSESYLIEDKKGTVFMAPIRTAGTYGRNLVIIRREGISLDFTMTYPNPDNKKHFFVTNLRSMDVKEIEIGQNGQDIHKIESYFRSEVGCDETIFVACSSGQHSFENMHTVSECEYWNNSGAGTPPSVFTIPGSCDGGGSTGGGAGGGEPIGGTDPNDGGYTGGGGTTVPPGGTDLPPLTHSDCIENLDCEDCNIPGDLNNDCRLNWEEVLLLELNLGRNELLEKNWFINTAELAHKQLISQFYWNNNKSIEARNFIIEAIRGWMAGGEVDFEEQIINLLSGEAKCIYEKLPTSGNDYVKMMLDKFEGDSKYSLKLISEDRVYHTDENGTTREVGGTTREPVNNVILIRMNSSFAQSKSSLGLAKDILHEIVHADMFRKLVQNNLSGNNEDIEFIETYNKFKNGNFQASPQHESMAKLYIDAMATSLKHFHKNVLINDYNKYVLYYNEDPSDEFYKSLAWAGLRNHDVQAYDDLDEEEKTIIESLHQRIGILTKDCFNE